MPAAEDVGDSPGLYGQDQQDDAEPHARIRVPAV